VKANSLAFRAIYLFVFTAGAALASGPTTAELDGATHDSALADVSRRCNNENLTL
jgi:hypothetical protein